MNKKEFVKGFTTEFATTNKDSEERIQWVLDTFHDSALSEGKVCFGKHRMEKKDYKERKGHNPRTGEKLIIPAKTKAAYRHL